LVTGATVGVEALVRWQHPVRGLLEPCDFLAVAEDTGLIRPIGAWVLGQACTFLAELHARGERLKVSVNLSARQLEDPTFVDEVAEIIERTGVDPESVVLEITETVLIEEAGAVCAALEHLRDFGISVAIDDFGTGYASLTYLKQLPVDILKIDMSFVRGLGHSHNDEAITRAVVELADALGLDVIAEGVESGMQRDTLVAMGCPSAQGYLFAKPLARDEFDAWLVASRARGTVVDLGFGVLRGASAGTNSGGIG
jgi:EAL domain-containing protein (putative c-di-GMP-specific phosphodiesterase class I)